MRFVVAGGGIAGLAAALAVARAGHSAVVLERDVVGSGESPDSAFAIERQGIPHYLQPHSFLPRGRCLLGIGLRTCSRLCWRRVLIRRTSLSI